MAAINGGTFFRVFPLDQVAARLLRAHPQPGQLRIGCQGYVGPATAGGDASICTLTPYGALLLHEQPCISLEK